MFLTVDDEKHCLEIDADNDGNPVLVVMIAICVRLMVLFGLCVVY